MKTPAHCLTALALLACFVLSACTTLPPPENPQGVHGMIAIKSVHDTKTTMDRFEAAVRAKDMTVFARINHEAGAAKIGKTLRPTEVLIWGSPQGGTPMMLCAQTAGIDLPQKALVWQDEKGVVYVGWNDPVHLVAIRHETPGCEAVTRQIAAAIRGFAQQAAN